MKLCIGIDPSLSSLAAWGLPASAIGARIFAGRLLEVAGQLGEADPGLLGSR